MIIAITVCIIKENQLLNKCINVIAKFFEERPEISFLGRGGLRLIKDVQVRRSDQNKKVAYKGKGV